MSKTESRMRRPACRSVRRRSVRSRSPGPYVFSRRPCSLLPSLAASRLVIPSSDRVLVIRNTGASLLAGCAAGTTIPTEHLPLLVSLPLSVLVCNRRPQIGAHVVGVRGCRSLPWPSAIWATVGAATLGSHCQSTPVPLIEPVILSAVTSGSVNGGGQRDSCHRAAGLTGSPSPARLRW